MSERRGCAALGVGRSGVRYRSTKPDQAPLRMRICDLAKSRVRYGYFRIYILLRREGWRVNHKRVHRLYRDEGLSLRLKRPRRHVSAAHRERQPAALRPNERWSMDFVSDALFDGRRLRALTVVDAFTREALAIEVDQGNKGEQVVAVVARLAMLRGAPCAIQVDNVLRSEEGRLARQQVSVREHAPAVCLSSTSIQAAPADPEELSAIANTGSSRCTRHRGPHRPQHEMSIQAGDPSIIYRVVVLTPSRLC